MPVLPRVQATERLASAVEKAKPNVIAEIYAELFPENLKKISPNVAVLAQHIRNELEAEEIVDLWNVVFPADRNVWYDEDDNEIHFNDEVPDYAQAD